MASARGVRPSSAKQASRARPASPITLTIEQAIYANQFHIALDSTHPRMPAYHLMFRRLDAAALTATGALLEACTSEMPAGQAHAG
jgi:hypothetical protein